MTDIDRKQLRGLCNDATPGPGSAFFYGSRCTAQEAEFLVAAIGALPALLDEIEAKDARIADLERQLAEAREALQNVKKIISEGALTGFDCMNGDWGNRLYASQQKTSATIRAILASAQEKEGE